MFCRLDLIRSTVLCLVVSLGVTCWTDPAQAQQRRFVPPVRSPEVAEDAQVTFRLRAAEAKSVRVSGGDMPQIGQGQELQKDDEGVWQLTLGPVAPGTYRYRLEIDGVAVCDPVNTSTSQSNGNAWSLVHVPGAAWIG